MFTIYSHIFTGSCMLAPAISFPYNQSGPTNMAAGLFKIISLTFLTIIVLIVFKLTVIVKPKYLVTIRTPNM